MLSTLKNWRNWLLYDLGAAFVLLGSFALYNAFIAWKLAQPGIGMLALYGILYLLLSYLFFTRGRWLMYLIGLNTAANICVWSYRAYTGTQSATAGVVIVLCNAALFAYLWGIRKNLVDTAAGRAVAGAVLVLWLVVLYSALTTL